MKQIELTYTISAPIDKVWQAFIDPDVIEEWGGGPAVMDEQEGTEFSLWGGEIHGVNTKVVAEKLLAQDWYSGDGWDEPSKLTISFAKEGIGTTVKLEQDNVPLDEVDEIIQGWEEFYLGPLQEYLEL